MASTKTEAQAALQGYLDERGMLRCELAAELGVEPSTVTRWLEGHRNPSPEMALRIERMIPGFGAMCHPYLADVRLAESSPDV